MDHTDKSVAGKKQQEEREKMRRMSKFKMVLSVICAAGMLAATSAMADSITFSLDKGNSDISGYTGPYGSVLVDLTSSTTAKITFTAATGRLFGSDGAVGVNVNASSFTYSDLTGSGPGKGPDFVSAALGNEDGFGAFNFSLKEFDGFGYALSTVSFVLTDTSGTWANAASVLTPNAGGAGYSAAAHVFVLAANGKSAVATGYAAGNPGNTIPTPPPQAPEAASTAILLGMALLGIGSLRNRFKRN